MTDTGVATIRGVETYSAKGYSDSAGMMCASGYRASKGEWFKGYGDLLLMTIREGAERPFHFHREGTDTIAAIAGEILVNLFDMREDSPTTGQIQTVRLQSSEAEVQFVQIPPMVAHAVKGVAPYSAVVDLASSEAQDGSDFFICEPGSVRPRLE